jgi:hypothetical protein
MKTSKVYSRLLWPRFGPDFLHGATSLVFAAIVILSFLATASNASAAFVLIENDAIRLNGSKADFGSGGHSNGRPNGSANVRWDYDVINGETVARASISGKIYLDDFFGGRVRLTIRYKNQGSGIFDTQVFTSPQMGFAALGAADPAHQFTIDPAVATRQSAALFHVELLVTYVADDGTICCGDSLSRSAPTSFTYLTRNSGAGVVGFGSGSYNPIEGTPPFYVGPTGDATVRFQRVTEAGFVGDITGSVDGSVFWNATSAGTIRIVIEYLDRDGAALRTARTFSRNCPGGNPNLGVNQLRITPNATVFTDGRLWRIRYSAGRVDSFGNFFVSFTRLVTLEGGVSNGTFELSPTEVSVSTREVVNYAFSWTVPDPLSWPVLHSLELRIRNGEEVATSILFDEFTRLFALVDERTGRIGPFFAAGSNHQLPTSLATVYLQDSSVQADGPTSPTVTLNLAIAFNAPAVGNLYVIEVAAADDFGVIGAFEPAGVVEVVP